MTASVNIKRGDLHLAVSTAFNRGRYVLMTDGAGRPTEITLDLKERPDDLLGSEPMTIDELRDIFERPFDGPEDPRIMAAQAMTRREAQAVLDHSGDLAEALTQPADDHGPTIPAQGEHYREAIETGSEKDASGAEWITREPGPRVYEFALQDCTHWPHIGLEQVVWADALDLTAADRADWVHVYDRVTRERRTLKRPEPDAVLTGLRDVAADLRKPHGAFPEAAFSGVRGAPVEPPFGCAVLPPVGPLTSTEGLKVGDILRFVCPYGGHKDGDLVRVRTTGDFNLGIEGEPFNDINPTRFAFVGRPDADGWMTWAGGENPVPGVRVAYRVGDDPDDDRTADSDLLDWSAAPPFPKAAIVAFRIVDTPPAM